MGPWPQYGNWRRFGWIARLLIVAGFFFYALLLLLGSSMSVPLFNDENQFVGGGFLLSRGSGVVYRDFLYLHMPYLAYLYAVLFTFSPFFLLSVRLFSIACAFLIILAVFYYTLRLFRDHHPLTRTLIALGVVAIILHNPLFILAARYGWTHTPSLLMSFLGLAVWYRALVGSSRKQLFVAGILTGLAIGFRFTFICMAAGLALAVVVFPPVVISVKERMKQACVFAAGCGLALIPVVAMAAGSFKRFVYGNFIYYARTTVCFWSDKCFTKGMSLAGKVQYLLNDVLNVPANLLPVFAFLFFFWASCRGREKKSDTAFPLRPMGLVLVFLLLGAFAPTPANAVYFCAPVFFSTVGCVYGLRSVLKHGSERAPIGIFFSLLVILCFVGTGMSMADLGERLATAVTARRWEPLEVHRIGEEIASLTEEGKIVTLAPVYAVEGRRGIYKEFSSGPFAWRTAQFLAKENRESYGVVSPQELTALLDKEPPCALLTGVDEVEVESALVEYARTHGYKEFGLSNGSVLFVASGRNTRTGVAR